jgi:hypothetical protein
LAWKTQLIAKLLKDISQKRRNPVWTMVVWTFEELQREYLELCEDPCVTMVWCSAANMNLPNS